MAENVVTDRQIDRQTDGRNDRPSTVTLAAHARRGLTTSTYGSRKVSGLILCGINTVHVTSRHIYLPIHIPCAMQMSDILAKLQCAHMREYHYALDKQFRVVPSSAMIVHNVLKITCLMVSLP